MPFNFSSSEYLSHHRTRKNQVSPVSRASPAHIISPLNSDLLVKKLMNSVCGVNGMLIRVPVLLNN